MKFERIWLLWLAPFVGVAAGVLALQARRVRLRAAAAWSARLGIEAAASGRWSPLVVGIIATLMVAGMSGVRWGLASSTAQSRSLNVAFVIDVSKSMLARDVPPDRMTRAVQIARRLSQDLSGDRLGLIAFAANAYLLSPLTLDGSAIAIQLDALNPSLPSVGGTEIASALTMAHKALTQSNEGGDRAIVLITDGEAFDGNDAILDAAGALKNDRITLVTVPVGSTRGARIPEPGGGWHLDRSGNVVITRSDVKLLTALTEAADGVLVPADAPDPVGIVRTALNRLDRKSVRDQVAADLVPRSWLFALVALVLLAGHAISRRTASLLGLLLCVVPAAGHAQRPAEAAQLLLKGDTAAALPAWVNEARASGSDTAWYNAGTAALANGSLADAIAALNRATMSVDPELRRRALYNLGTAQLLQARVDSVGGDSLARLATANLRNALKLAPANAAAKFNYELARRLMRPPPPSNQGGGGKSQPQPGAEQSPQPNGGMSKAEAEQVLGATERAETETRRELARRRQGTPTSGPDW